MIEFRTSPLWRGIYWVVTLVQAVLLSASLAAGAVASIIVSLVFLGVFFLLAVQSRSPVTIGPDGIADDRVMIRRAWPWDTIEAVQVRAPSLIRPDVTIRNGRGRVLPLNMRGLVARRNGERIERGEAVDALARLARRKRVTVDDQR